DTQRRQVWVGVLPPGAKVCIKHKPDGTPKDDQRGTVRRSEERSRFAVTIKIFADTTQFIDFYQSNKNPLAIFDDLEKHKGLLVTTEQTVNEFHRNRIPKLRDLLQAFLASIRPVHTVAVLKDCNAHKDLCEAAKSIKPKVKSVEAYLEELIRDETKD